MGERPFGVTADKGGCKGWNYHVWSLSSGRCVMCGKTRQEAAEAVSSDG